ncbi:MAG: DNA-directed RNA polymerase subunit delta [Sporomusaceae bacterium]|nr:DNA-directed RNA polymerase subunit delta [Sporomusaceae bacterium]
MSTKEIGSEADIAYQILRQAGAPMHFRDLINQVLVEKGGPVYSRGHAMAEVHTQVNIDSRFFHVGKGEWGLVEWTPQRVSGRMSEEPADKSYQTNLRREKLLEEIQQDYVKVPAEPEELDENP